MFKNFILLLLLLTTSFCANNTTKAEDGELPKEIVQPESSISIPKVKTEKGITVDNNAIQLLEMVNQLRKKGCRCGRKKMKSAPSLKMNRLLNQAAKNHANDMASNNFFEHRGSNGSKISERISKTGYDWQAVGENIFWGDVEIKEVFQGWKDSPSHCKNMMDKEFLEMGFAKSGIYWVQDFGKKF